MTRETQVTKASQPNVVFIVSDQHRWDFIGYEDNGVTFTPELDALAEEGVVFGGAYCTAPLCSPSRAAIALGRYGMNSGCFTNLHEPSPHSPSFVDELRSAGWRTSCIGKTHMEIHAYDADYTSERHKAYMRSLGWDDVCDVAGAMLIKTGIRCEWSEWLRRQGKFMDVVNFYTRHWSYFMDKVRKQTDGFEAHEWELDETYRVDRFIFDRSMEWLTDHARKGPFFLHVGFIGPHEPEEPLSRYMDLYRDREEALPWGVETCSPVRLNGRRGYRAWISELSNYVGQLRGRVSELGLADNTIFIFTADHGEMAGDHGRLGKTMFFEGSMRVPMIFAGPGVPRGKRSDAFVELIDLGKTVCDLCGVPSHVLDQGRSLAPILRGERETHRDTVYAEMGCDRMIRDERYKLHWGDPISDTRKLGRLHLDKPVTIPASPGRLYDLQEDPHELHNLIDEPTAQPVVRWMLEKLLARINENIQPQPNKSRGEYRPCKD